MESTGVRNKIQCSAETADLLTAAGREKWITPREDTISVRGKGIMQTYFLKVISGSKASGETADTEDTPTRLGSECKAKEDRLVNWNVEVLSGLLRKILARRAATGKSCTLSKHLAGDLKTPNGMTVLDEVAEIISLPAFDGTAIRKQVDPDSITLKPKVVEELLALVAEFASMYRKNPFHSFEHASHVTMSVLKMLSRIENPKEIVATRKGGEIDLNALESQLHDHTL